MTRFRLAELRDAFTRIVLFILRVVQAAPLAVLTLAIASAVGCGVYSVRNLDIDTDTAGMISEDLPFRRLSREFSARFPGLSDNVVIVIDADIPDRADAAAAALVGRLRANGDRFPLVFSPETNPFFLRNGLLYLDIGELERLSVDLADAQALLTRLAGDPSLRGLAAVMADAVAGIEDDPARAGRLADVMNRFAEVAESVADGRPQPLSWQALIGGGAPDKRRIILTKPRVDFSSLTPAAEAMEVIRTLAGEAGLTPENGVTVRLTGSVVISTEELESVTSGARKAGLISLVLVAILLAVGIRSGRMVLAILVALVIGLLWTAGFTTFAIGHLNLVSVAFAVLFIGLGVDFGIHFGLRFREERFLPGSQADAVRRTGRGTAPALGLSALAAAVAFLSFVPTDYRGLSELGLIAGAGMFIALVATYLVVPAVNALLPPGIPVAHPAGNPFPVPRRRAAILALVLGAVSAATLPFARFDFDPIKLRDPATESVRTFRDLAAMPGASPYTMEALAPSLEEAEALSVRLGALDLVEKTVTAADLVPREQDDKLAVIDDLNVFLAPLRLARPEAPPDAAARARAIEDLRASMRTASGPRFPAAFRAGAQRLNRALAAAAAKPAALEGAFFQFFDLQLSRLRTALDAGPVGLDDLPPEIRSRYLSESGVARVQVYPKENLQDADALRRFVEAVRRVAPAATDSPVEILEAGRAVVRSVITAAVISAVAIALLVFLLLRSLRDTILVLIPLALSGLYTVAATVLLGWAFNFANVIVLPLLMGLGVASGIHLVVRAREARSGSAAFATTTPRAVVFSALTTIASFGSLAVSSHRGTASMGELLTLSISVTLVCTLLVLPALMRLWPPSRTSRSGGAG